MHFEILGEITDIEVIASGKGIRRLKVLRKRYGGRHWRTQGYYDSSPGQPLDPLGRGALV